MESPSTKSTVNAQTSAHGIKRSKLEEFKALLGEKSSASVQQVMSKWLDLLLDSVPVVEDLPWWKKEGSVYGVNVGDTEGGIKSVAVPQMVYGVDAGSSPIGSFSVWRCTGCDKTWHDPPKVSTCPHEPPPIKRTPANPRSKKSLRKALHFAQNLISTFETLAIDYEGRMCPEKHEPMDDTEHLPCSKVKNHCQLHGSGKIFSRLNKWNRTYKSGTHRKREKK